MLYRNRRLFGALFFVLAVASSAVAPAMAESQSTNSSSNCSNGDCSRVDTLVIEDDRGRIIRGWQRIEVWEEWRDRSTGDRRPYRDRDD